MDWSEIRASPAGRLFQADFRRLWGGKSVRRMVLVLVPVLLLQLVVGYTALTLAERTANERWYLLLNWGGMLGLSSSWATRLVLSAGAVNVPPVFSLFSQPHPAVTAMLGLPEILLTLLLPALAALSVAPALEQRRIPDLLLAGLTPRQIFRAKGLAALLPLLLLSAATQLAWGGVWLYGAVQQALHQDAVYLGPPLFDIAKRDAWRLVSEVGQQGTFLVTAALLVSISVLSRRTRTALVACYAAAFLALPMLQFGISLLLPRPLLITNGEMWSMLATWTQCGFFALILAFAYSLALRVLEYPEGHLMDGSPGRKQHEGTPQVSPLPDSPS